MPVIQSDLEEYARREWGPLVTKLQEENKSLRDKLRKYEDEAFEGRDFSVLLKAIREDENCMEHWKKIMLFLRLRGHG